jgi:hypothetical protein
MKIVNDGAKHELLKYPSSGVLKLAGYTNVFLPYLRISSGDSAEQFGYPSAMVVKVGGLTLIRVCGRGRRSVYEPAYSTGVIRTITDMP